MTLPCPNAHTLWQVSTICVYFIAGLRSGGEYVIYFILDLFLSLTVVESLMMVSRLLAHLCCVTAGGCGAIDRH